MDQHGPDVDEDEESDVGEFGQREQEREDVVGKALGVTVQRVESVRGERRRHDPLVVRFVDVLVHFRVVESAVDPVDAQIREEDENGKLHVVVPAARPLSRCVVQLRVAAGLRRKTRARWKMAMMGKCNIGLLHLELDLVLEVSRVLEGALVEYEDIGGGGENIVDDYAE